jgi:hypothetical protein
LVTRLYGRFDNLDDLDERHGDVLRLVIHDVEALAGD